MSDTKPLLSHVSDTARLVAAHRAEESERADALFHDPYARRLSGLRGEQFAQAIEKVRATSWVVIVRTHLLDQIVERAVAEGVDAVVNLGAGLDARPYRMKLPASLRWYEADLPGVLEEKQAALADERPACALMRVDLDLADAEARRALFARVGAEARKVLVLSEGLMGYLRQEDAAALARDLAAVPTFYRWAMELASPGLLRRLKREIGDKFEEGSAVFRFAPEEGPGFFEAYGWKAIEVRSVLKAAARVKRVGALLRLAALIPEPAGGRVGSRPWVGVCLMGRLDPTRR